jgi:hypothetical protein
MNRINRIIKIKDAHAVFHSSHKDDLDIVLEYDYWHSVYTWLCIRDAIRRPGRDTEPTLKAWLVDNEQNKRDVWARIVDDWLTEIGVKE